ncbi:glycosyltransferase [Streptacidiphilus cavernicola]|uniref:Glycosyltransferase n=1 Tax=Streptacidiphilus cavernicola TaxID=3342716 RepID=A0ABV6VZF6_9ACTN
MSNSQVRSTCLPEAEPAVRPSHPSGRTGGSTVMPALLLAASGCTSVLLHVLAGRLLGPADYGALGVVLGLVATVGVPMAALQTLFGGLVVRSVERGGDCDVRPLLRRALATAAAVCAVLAPGCRPAAAALHLSGPLPLLLALAFVLPNTACVVLWSRVYGVGGWSAVVAPAAVGNGVRLLVAAAALLCGGAVNAVLAATVLGEVVTALLLHRTLLHRTLRRDGRDGGRDERRNRGQDGVRAAVPAPAAELGGDLDPGPDEVLAPGWRASGRAVLTIAGLGALTSVDLVCARRWLPDAEVGSYVAGAFLAKAVLGAAQTLVVLLLGRLASADARTSARAQRQGLLACAVTGTAVTAGFALCGRNLIPLLLGPGYLVPPVLGLWLGAAATLLLMLTLLLHSHVSAGTSAPWAWVAVAAFPVLALLLPRTADGIAAALALSAAAAVGIAYRRLPTAAVRGDAARTPQGGGSLPGGRPLGGLGQAAELELTMVVPYYNPGPAVVRHVRELLRVLDQHGCDFEVLAVSDGCTDSSELLLAELVHPRLRRIGYPVNAGKGAAVRTGFAQGRGRWLGFIDADGDLPAHLVPRVLDVARGGDLDAAVGSKELGPGGTGPDYGAVRSLCSHGYRAVTRALFRLPVGDTQTGLKVFRREALAEVLPLCRENRFVFDLELLALLHRRHYRRVARVPVEFHFRTSSTVGPAAVLTMLLDTVRVRWRLLNSGAAAPRRSAARSGRGLPAPAAHPRISAGRLLELQTVPDTRN